MIPINQAADHGRRALSTTTITYTITVSPAMVNAQTPSGAYGAISQALQKSVTTPSAGGPDTFTLMMIQLARTTANSGITSSSVAIPGGIQISSYSSLPPTMAPSRAIAANSADSAAAVEAGKNATIGIVIGVLAGVILIAAGAYYYQRRMHKDDIPERDVSLANMQHTHEAFDSETVTSPLPAGGRRKQSLIDIIPAAHSAHPLSLPGSNIGDKRL